MTIEGAVTMTDLENAAAAEESGAAAGTSESQNQPTPEAGKGAEGTPHVDGEAGEQGTAQGAEGASPAESGGKEADGEKKPRDFEAAKSLLSGKQSPEERVKDLERNYSASSREATRLQGELKARDELLDSLGVKVARDEDGNARLVATGKKAKEAEAASLAYADMSRKDRKALEDLLADEPDPEEVSKFFAERVGERNISISAPAADSIVSPASPERIEQAFTAVHERYGEIHPNLMDNREPINWLRENAPKEVQRAFNAEPEYMIGLLNAQVEAAFNAQERMARKSEAERKRKQEEAQRASNLGGESGQSGSPMIGGSRSTAGNNVAAMIAAAE